ncbi:GOLPH3/VPS74 family protein [Oerskovia flava]|uniref:GOLPH3/VPS74 family protein n=1 Tax=Oerskovia flava TaxID=2986422 RepID=UPI002240645B|nr:GPP34 family phosphoprotein [Oerskovia sp. JB1-3-2]
MLIAEDLLLLLFDDESGKATGDTSMLEQVTAGALLVELTLLGRVDLTHDAPGVRGDRLVVRDGSPTGSVLLDRALAVIHTKQGSKPKNIIGPLAKDKPTGQVLASLAARGILRREDERILGIFPTTRWPAEDSRHEDAVRAGLWRVLVDGSAPDERTAALVAILAATGRAGKVVGAPDRRAADRRAKEVAAGSWAGDATRRYLAEVAAAVTAALTASMAAVAASG